MLHYHRKYPLQHLMDLSTKIHIFGPISNSVFKIDLLITYWQTLFGEEIVTYNDFKLFIFPPGYVIHKYRFSENGTHDIYRCEGHGINGW